VEEKKAHALEMGSQTYAAEDAQDQTEDWRVVLIHFLMLNITADTYLYVGWIIQP